MLNDHMVRHNPLNRDFRSHGDEARVHLMTLIALDNESRNTF